MRIIFLLCLTSLMLAVNAGCSLVSDFSDYVFPEEEDNETPASTESTPNSVQQTVGGGTCTSADYKLTVSIGMPQPMGKASSENHLIRVGPNAIQK